MSSFKYLNPKAVFDKAIALKILSTDEAQLNYAGDWMYMHSDASCRRHVFKHVLTRQSTVLEFLVSK